MATSDGFFKKSLHLLQKIDFISPEPKLQTYGHSRYKNILGGIISIAMICSVSVLTIYFLVIMWSRSSITVIYNTDNQQGEKSMEFTKYPFLIALTDINGGGIYDSDSYFSIVPKVWSIKRIIDENGNTNFTVTNYDLVLKQCDWKDYSNNSEIVDLYKNVPDFSYWKCFLPTENLNFYGLFGGILPNFFVTFYINKCVNSTNLDGQICKPQVEIERKLDTAFLVYSYVDFKINNNNITTAAQKYLRTDSLIISSTIYKRFMVKFKQIEYKTDYGFVFSDYRTENFYSIEPYYENVDNRLIVRYPGNFCSLTLSISPNLDTYQRYYMKFQDAIANIGGVLQGIIFVAVLICHYFSEKLFFASLANEVINYDDMNQRGKRIINLNSNLNNNSLKIIRKTTFYEVENKKKNIKNMSNMVNNTINMNESGIKIECSIDIVEEKLKHNAKISPPIANNYLNKSLQETK